MEKNLDESSSYKSAPKAMIIQYTVPEIWCVMDVIVILILGYTSYHHFTQVYQNS